MKHFSDKELIVELLQFMRSSNRKEILLKDYIRITDPRIHWTKRRVQALHKAIHATKAFVVDYVSIHNQGKDRENKETATIQYIRVKRTEVQHLNQLGAVPTEKRRNDDYQKEQKVYRILWRDRSRTEMAAGKRTAAAQEKQAKRTVS